MSQAVGARTKNWNSLLSRSPPLFLPLICILTSLIVTKVTSDGEPHAMMTMVAGLSGLLAAIIILAVLVPMVACRKRKRYVSNPAALVHTNDLLHMLCCLHSKRAKEEQQLAQQQQQHQINTIPSAVAMTSVTMPPQLAGNLNAAFAESTLTLSDNDKQQDNGNQSPSTTIIVERY